MILDVSTSFIQDVCFRFCMNAHQLFVKGQWLASCSNVVFTGENIAHKKKTNTGKSSHPFRPLFSQQSLEAKKNLKQVPALHSGTYHKDVLSKCIAFFPIKTTITNQNHSSDPICNRSNSDLVQCLTVTMTSVFSLVGHSLWEPTPSSWAATAHPLSCRRTTNLKELKRKSQCLCSLNFAKYHNFHANLTYQRWNLERLWRNSRGSYKILPYPSHPTHILPKIPCSDLIVLLEATWDFGREGTAPFSLCKYTIDNPELSDSFNASKVTSLPSNMGHGEEERQNKTKHTSSIIIYVHLSSFINIYHHLSSFIHHPSSHAPSYCMLDSSADTSNRQLPPDLLRFVERPVSLQGILQQGQLPGGKKTDKMRDITNACL